MGDTWGDGIRIVGSRSLVTRNVTTGAVGFGLHLLPSASGNVYGGNVARGNAGSLPGCSATNVEFCDEGTGNTSNGDNFLPDRM